MNNVRVINVSRKLLFIFAVIFISTSLQSSSSGKTPVQQIDTWLNRIHYKEMWLKRNVFEFIDEMVEEKNLSYLSEKEKLEIWNAYVMDYGIVYKIIVAEYQNFYTEKEFYNLLSLFNNGLVPDKYYGLLQASENSELIISLWLDENIGKAINNLKVSYPALALDIDWNTSHFLQANKRYKKKFDLPGSERLLSSNPKTALPLYEHFRNTFSSSLAEDITDNLKRINKIRYTESDYMNMQRTVAENLKEILLNSSEPMISVLRLYSNFLNDQEVSILLNYLSSDHRKNTLEFTLFEKDLSVKLLKAMPKMANFKMSLHAQLKRK